MCLRLSRSLSSQPSFCSLSLSIVRRGFFMIPVSHFGVDLLELLGRKKRRIAVEKLPRWNVVLFDLTLYVDFYFIRCMTFLQTRQNSRNVCYRGRLIEWLLAIIFGLNCVECSHPMHFFVLNFVYLSNAHVWAYVQFNRIAGKYVRCEMFYLANMWSKCRSHRLVRYNYFYFFQSIVLGFPHRQSQPSKKRESTNHESK